MKLLSGKYTYGDKPTLGTDNDLKPNSTKPLAEPVMSVVIDLFHNNSFP